MRSIALLMALAGLPVVQGGGQEVHGYVLATQPNTANYVADNGYQYNSTGGIVEITRSGTGRYQVRFAGMGTPGGFAHVQPYGSLSAAMCTVTSWGAPFGLPDLYVYVRCFNAAGALADSKFVAYFSNRTVNDGRFAYLWADHTSGAPYVPNAAYAYDSTGDPITVTPHDVGVYKVYFNALLGLDAAELSNGQLQVTAYNTAAVRCTIGIDDDENPIAVTVVCRDASGDHVNTRFVASYSYGVSHLGTSDPHGSATIDVEAGSASVFGWGGTGETPTVIRVGAGVYQVKFPSLDVPKGNAIVSSLGSLTYCHVSSWLPSITGEEVVNVRCDADVAYNVAFST